MKKIQYGIPIILSKKDGSTLPLTRIELSNDAAFEYSEDWLQDKIFQHPSLLPINEIDPVFGTLYPVCRELGTAVGPLDNLYINDLGMLTLVECKLWRNPEARRTVIGQILDYAQEFSRMSYEDLIGRINRKTGESGNSLFEIVSANTEGLSEREFVDSVASNLKKGRFLLLVVGDGIRESTENISEYLQEHAHLNFTFALVEQCLYKIGDGNQPDILIMPRVLAKTVEIERAVVRIEGNATTYTITTDQPESQPDGPRPGPRRGSITEQYFFEQIEKISPNTAVELRKLIARLLERDLTVAPGEAYFMIKDKEMAFNFLAFKIDGTIRNFGIGRFDLGKTYMDKLAEVLGDGIVYASSNPFQSTVKRSDGSYFRIQDIIDHQDQWLSLIDEVLEKLSANENNENPDNAIAT